MGYGFGQAREQMPDMIVLDLMLPNAGFWRFARP